MSVSHYTGDIYTRTYMHMHTQNIAINIVYIYASMEVGRKSCYLRNLRFWHFNIIFHSRIYTLRRIGHLYKYVNCRVKNIHTTAQQHFGHNNHVARKCCLTVPNQFPQSSYSTTTPRDYPQIAALAGNILGNRLTIERKYPYQMQRSSDVQRPFPSRHLSLSNQVSCCRRPCSTCQCTCPKEGSIIMERSNTNSTWCSSQLQSEADSITALALFLHVRSQIKIFEPINN